MTDIAIVAAVRTPVGSFRGAFAPLSAIDLGAAVVRGLLERCQLPAAAVDELIFGQVLTAGCGQNPARQTALRAGLPVDTPAVTVNLVCGSGLKAVQQAVQAIRCGDAGNASSLNDGAAAVLLMRVDKARELGLPVLARIVSSAVAGVDPSVMGIGPVSACRQALQRAGWTLDEVDLIEANEAFAVQALAVGQLLEWDSEKVNVNGGAIALGHPIGASGCRILVSLVHEMQRRGASKGLATLCVGGGQGIAMTLQR
ncbi:TPA: hypothetical protein MDU73_004396 [Klebsiella pneumoniae]|nr:hypothetical protein [Klebsiella pneumoniae]